VSLPTFQYAPSVYGRYQKLQYRKYLLTLLYSGSANHGRKKPVHCDASYLFTEGKGIYQTLYYSPPLGEE
jgi:hypothetical protein